MKTVTGADVRRLRSELGLSQAELAKLLGLSSGTVANWETRNRMSAAAQLLIAGLVKQTANQREGLVAARQRLRTKEDQVQRHVAHTGFRNQITALEDLGDTNDADLLEELAKDAAELAVEGIDVTLHLGGLLEPELNLRDIVSKLHEYLEEQVNFLRLPEDIKLPALSISGMVEVLAPSGAQQFQRRARMIAVSLLIPRVYLFRDKKESTNCVIDAIRYRYLKAAFKEELGVLLSHSAEDEHWNDIDALVDHLVDQNRTSRVRRKLTHSE